ncbi:AAA family ATPase [Helicobacter saguini]|uniref:AAA family ATPase n=1 Tax=Helicobacter saguini TaxID=1548018 RepID=A0A347VR77_9HELI|nr:zeta toxin family protein [Helicobacter saguini]MWV63007.1 AAA family ATPase [Helicobacter saguini]MWV66324.1 AAA family ATPase [Helicobacter saguini]MWV68676.1 AAA family ATPase [Helicobacter saguini]MWV71773.1 AAA family ATPase [Helicobacter saguini]TLD95802.1 hypothetical protein LS64_000050 [Helicobacter saguini]
MLNSEIIEKIWHDVYKNQTPQDNPQGFVLGGQPGAGKSSLIEKIKNQLQDNVIVINGDDYRRYHPQYAELQEKYGKDSVNKTADFAAKMTESILQKAINGRFNIVIEGTFRTSETPIKTLKLFKDNGYKTHILIQTCNKSISSTSCNERYEKMRNIMPNEARYTPKDKHDIVCENLAKNINEVYLSGFTDSLKIFIRNDIAGLKIEKFFDSTLDSNLDIEKLEKIINDKII